MFRTVLLLIILPIVAKAQWDNLNTNPQIVANWQPPAFTISQIDQAETLTFREGGSFWQVSYFRNAAYDCGLSGTHSFIIIEPRDGDDASLAPLWMFLHGGGMGYFAADGTYQATRGQTQDTWNHEEGLGSLLASLEARITDPQGSPEDTTLRRRLQEGYRLLLPSMCDHDFYSGLGTPYPNNLGRQVNGLQATQAALAYARATRPTDKTFLHGTSAGAIGAYSLALAASRRGWHVDGAILDSSVLTPRLWPVFKTYQGHPRFPFSKAFETSAMMKKVGALMDPAQAGLLAEYQIAAGFDDVPLIFLFGMADVFCAGQLPLVPEASENNCLYVASGVLEAIQGQSDSPHQIKILPGVGHVPTNKAGFANDLVDDFIAVSRSR